MRGLQDYDHHCFLVYRFPLFKLSLSFSRLSRPSPGPAAKLRVGVLTLRPGGESSRLRARVAHLPVFRASLDHHPTTVTLTGSGL